MPTKKSSEFEYIDWIRLQMSNRPLDVVRGIGDDCAVLRHESGEILVTTDMLLEGSHFRLSEIGPWRVGRKALAVNLSDIAAMGGVPRWAVVSLGLPRNISSNVAKDLFRGMQAVASRFETAIVGGDTNSWSESLVISITLIGVPGPHGPVYRSGARVGDWLFVTGSLGGSLAGKHLDFSPRLAEVAALQRLVRPSAMIDISDGLAADVGHLCEESRVGAVLFAERIPLSVAACCCHDGTALEHGLADGEDFELAFSVSPDDGRRLLQSKGLGTPLTHIGEFIANPGLWLEHQGSRSPLAPVGYSHDFGEPST